METFFFKAIIYIPIIYLTFYSAYWLATILLGIAYKKKRPTEKNENNPELLLILPAYKPSKIFSKVLDSIKVAISNRNIKVFVLLQDAEPHYKGLVEAYGFMVEEKSFKHLTGNSYHHALHYIKESIIISTNAGTMDPNFVMLIDKDNLLSPDFFAYIKMEVYQKYDVIQAKRTSINTDGSVSFFDTISEGLNDTMFRASKSLLGGTIEISGSGALIRTNVFLKAIDRLDGNAPGYDKNFMVQLLSADRKVRTTYLPYVQLFEEKTSEIESYNPQRLRWFGEQYYNAFYSVGKLLNAFFKYGRFSAIDYLLVLWRPPRSIQILIVPILGFIEITAYAWQGYWWLGFPFLSLSSLFLFLASIIFLLKTKLLWTSLNHAMALPLLAMHNAFNARNSIKKENQGKFIHTDHKM